MATWNVADPFYFAGFWPEAAFGFDFDREDSRLDAIKNHVEQLLGLADVVGLQEVPADLVERLVRCGSGRDFESQWVAAPSNKDTEWYEAAVGKRGCSSAIGGIAAAHHSHFRRWRMTCYLRGARSSCPAPRRDGDISEK